MVIYIVQYLINKIINENKRREKRSQSSFTNFNASQIFSHYKRQQYLMEDQRKKYLLNRIKKQELVLQADFDNFKRVFQSRSIPDERNESYVELINSLMDHNNQFALNLIEYLEKKQIKDIFQRSWAIFNDLLSKYKKAYQDWRDLEEGKDVKEIRQICQICQEQIEGNHIQNMKIILDRQSQARSNLIKKLIEQTEKQRVKPLFTREEDQAFKQELDKVLKRKEMSIQNNLQESNIFLQAVTKEMSDFMVSFRNDFASWQHSSVQENNNWATTMKGYLNKKLTNSFHQKMPQWIKKMHNFFVISQPIKPKIFYATREVQTSPNQSPQQGLLKKEIQQLKKRLELKRQKMQELFNKIEMQKIRSEGLQKELSRMQKYMVDKVYQAKLDKKNENKVQSKQSNTILSPNEQRDGLNIITSNLKEVRQIPKGVIIPAKSKKNVQKLIKTPNNYNNKMTFESVQKENFIQDQPQIKPAQSKYVLPSDKKEKQSLHSELRLQHKSSHASSLKNSEVGSYRSKDNIILKSTLPENQSIVQLKKKGYNREKRQELVNEKKIDAGAYKGTETVKNKAVSSNLSQVQMGKLKQEVKNIGQILKNSRSHKNTGLSQIKLTQKESVISEKSSRSTNKDRLNSSLQQSIIKPLMLTQTGQQMNFQGEIQKKMKGYLQNHKKGANILELKEISNLLRHYLNTLPTKQLFKPEKESVFPSMVSNEQLRKGKPLQNSSMLKSKHKTDLKQDRYCKSLHVDRNVQVKSLKLPKIIKNDYGRLEEEDYQHRKNSMDKSCLNLFIDNETAYFYEQSLSQASKSKNIVKPSPGQLQAIEQLFSELEAIKKTNHGNYTQIVSFLKHPYTAIKCQFLTLDVVNEITFASFCNYFLKILWLHRKCNQKQGENFCGHINTFAKQIRSFKLK